MGPRLLHYSDVENAYDRPTHVARLAGVLDARRDEATVVAGTGDNTGPGVLALVEDGRQAIDLFDRVEPEVETIGNHDFDHGRDGLRSLIRDSPQTWVCANVRNGSDPFAASQGVVPATTVRRDGSTIGVIGVTDTATPSMAPPADGLTFEDPLAAVRRELKRLRPDVDATVVLSHVGNSERIAAETDVDAVLAGHVHDPRGDVIDGTVLTRPGANGRYVYEIDLESGEYRRLDVERATPVEAVETALTDRLQAAGLDETVAHVDEPLYRDRDTKIYGEFRLGNFVTDAFRWAADADVAIQNVGGIREGPPLSGAVTLADMISVIPFDMGVATAEVTGAELLDLAREADGRRMNGVPDYWMAQVSGMDIERDGDGYEVTVDGDAVEPSETFRLATSEYILYTDREFPTLTTDHHLETHETSYEVLAEYAREAGIDPSIEGRLPEMDR